MAGGTPTQPPPEGEGSKQTQAWTEDDLRRDPHAAADKASRVRRMFAAIAPKYDLNNRLHSFGHDQAWRRAAVRMAELKSTDVVVDVACGTGDLALAFHRTKQRAAWTTRLPAKTVGIDFTFEMLPFARLKFGGYCDEQHRLADVADDEERWKEIAAEHGRATAEQLRSKYRASAVRLVNGDAMALPLPDACCDVVSIAFGIRNVAEPAKAMREFYRVLRPGGRVIVLEFSQPTNPLIRWGNNLYCGKIMPYTATWIAGDKSGAYKYLPKSVDTFITREGMVSMMEASGFRDVVLKPLTFGVSVVYRGVKK